MLTPATFKARYPEFLATSDALVQQALDEAVRSSDEHVFGARMDEAVALLAAHKLATSAFGQPSRLESESAETTYGKARAWLEQVCVSPLVTGQGL